MDRIKARQATRKKNIEDVQVVHIRRGEPFFPKGFFLRGNEESDEAWQIFLTTRSGLQPSQSEESFAFSKEDVDSFLANHPVGSELLERLWSAETDKHIFRQRTQSRSPFTVHAGDRESPLALDVLGDAGIYEERYGSISKEVTEYLGKERVNELKDDYDENWNIVAAFEYCWIKLPHSSPAFVAASYQFHTYITEDDFSAGYHWRDLEVLVHGVEETAQQTLDTRKRAGQSGRKKSVEAREKRRNDLLDKIEVLVARSPDIVKFGVKAITDIAVKECVEDNPALWRQGRGQVAEYLGEIRRGEAGLEIQLRYKSIFVS